MELRDIAGHGHESLAVHREFREVEGIAREYLELEKAPLHSIEGKLDHWVLVVLDAAQQVIDGPPDLVELLAVAHPQFKCLDKPI